MSLLSLIVSGIALASNVHMPCMTYFTSPVVYFFFLLLLFFVVDVWGDDRVDGSAGLDSVVGRGEGTCRE